ncbi:hypothetical protein Pmani_023819 [Petrolisthes manimaculis]|uniref:Uncharacterized protein n=1 Tax=Petrolisthes manimaculis TaxID=1843537 RepID=A0AAE1P8Q7_9EUCA|nr:hypothetical protein Pmani_023819 [Petrolisthes manimaculis]
MKFLVLSCLVVAAVALPQYDPRDQEATIIVDERSDSGDGNFQYRFQTSNGIDTQKVGVPGSQGQSNMNGGFSFTLPDGTVAQVNYVADEFGYRAESPLIPTPHPLPAHVHELLRIAEEQRAAGITFN